MTHLVLKTALTLALCAPTAALAADGEGIVTGFTGTLAAWGILNLLAGLAVLFGGWLVASLAAKGTERLLRRTTVDDRLAKTLGVDALLAKSRRGKRDGGLEHLLGRVVFWGLMLIVIVAALDAAGLNEAAGPFRGFLDTVTAALPRAGYAALILLVAYFAGVVLRRLVTGLLVRIGMDRAMAPVPAATTDADAAADAAAADAKDEAAAVARPFSETAGTVAFWVTMLVGLAGAFNALELEAISQPLEGVVARVLALLPNLAAAALILVGGYLLARIARTVIANLLASVGFDRLPAKIGIQRLLAQRTASDIIGVTVMVVILLHAAIAALEQLGLASLSLPIGATIAQFWAMLPALALALIFIGVGLVVGRLVGHLIERLLRGFGFDGWLSRMGLDIGKLQTKEMEAAAAVEGDATVPSEGEAVELAWRVRTPSGLVGALAQLGVVLIAVQQALLTLGLVGWAEMVDALLAYLYLRGLVALAIVGLGFMLGNIVRDLIARGADPGRAWIANAARIAVLVFAFAMALTQLEVAPSFVLLSFGLLFGAVCLAVALAFGLGGREVAGEVVRKRYEEDKN